MDIERKDIDVELEVTEVFEGGEGTNDYEKLSNLPTLNGETIIGDMHEQDPTVPEWAKQADKPTYNAEDVGAVDVNSAMTYADIDEVFSMVFKNKA